MLRRTIFSKRTFALLSGGTFVAAGGGYYYLNSGPAYPPPTRETRRPPPPWTPPSRAQMLDTLRASDYKDGDSYQDEFDLLIVGGGATGAGVAVDAASRGLKVALVERDDFSAGTSSKSTKLVHGGVRYLQKAVMELDYEQYKLVKEALHERRIFLQTAPYLSAMLPIMLPIYKYWQVPYYWLGCKMYDILAGEENMESSYLMSKGKALEAFPMLKADGLVGAVVYYDGQHNDSRMNIALIMTAVQQGAVVANHVEVTELHKDHITRKIHGARVQDRLTGKEWNVRAKGIINATGPFSDSLLTMDNPSHKPIVQPSSGIHITLPNYYSPRKMGLLDPSTSDGRVIFFLPWQGNTIAGTTDTAASVPVQRDPPTAPEEEIRWVLEEVRRYLSPDIRVRRGDVLSAWSGLRPLIRNTESVGGKGDGKTEGLVRNHVVLVSESGLVTIAGGKWTTYRAMSEECVDKAIEVFGLEGGVKTDGCVTDKLRLVGSHGWSRNMFIGLIQRYGLETEVAKHLSENYGDRAWIVCEFSQPTGVSWPLHGIRLSPGYPFIEAEIRYAVKHEYALTAIDAISRRCRLSFLNAQAALDALPRVIDIMSEELGWNDERRRKEMEDAVGFLGSMGLSRGAQGGLTRPSMVSSGVASDPSNSRGVWEWVGMKQGLFGSWKKRSSGSRYGYGYGGGEVVYSRAQFEPGEIEMLRKVFAEKAGHDTPTLSVSPSSSPKQVLDSREYLQSSRNVEAQRPRVGKGELFALVKGLPGYGGIKVKDFEYVLEEVGFASRSSVDFDEFVEICAELREVLFAPVPSTKVKSERRRIPVEKSGGGV